MSYPNEEAKASVNSLQTRLFPKGGSVGSLTMKAAPSGTTLRPRGIQMSKSAAVLPASDAVRSKVSLDLNARTLSKSSSAFFLGKTSSQSGLGN